MIPFEPVRAPGIGFVGLSALAWALLPTIALAQVTPPPAIPQREVAARDPLQCNPETRSVSANGAGVTPDGRKFFNGQVFIRCDNTQVFADEISWNDTTAWAKGSVLVIQDDLRVEADSVEMDRLTKLATFFNARGTARLTQQPVEKSKYGTMEPEVSFAAAKVQKMGPATYRLTGGWFTTCMQTPPRWEISGSQGTITLDERVLLKNAVFRVKGIPVLYLPIIYYPMEKDDRATGFLLPTYSASNVTGQGLSTAFFLAIDRSQDATFFYDRFSKTGNGFGAEYRFAAAPGSGGRADFYLLNEKNQFADDGTIVRPAGRSYTVNGETSQRLGRFRLIANVRYHSNVTTQQLYQENLYDFSARDRVIDATLSRDFRYVGMSTRFERRDIYRTPQVTERLGRRPQFKLWARNQVIPLGYTNLYVGAEGEVYGIDRHYDLDDPLSNRSLWRFDAAPTVYGPISKLGWLTSSVRATWRMTRWTDSQDPLTTQLRGMPLGRSLFDVGIDAGGPKLVRTFQTPKSKYAESFKHLIEPSVSYSWLSNYDQRNLIVQNDTIDSLAVGTSRLDYGIRSSVSAKVRQPGGTAHTQTLLRFGVNQSYYTDARAAAVDTQYQTTTIGSFSNINLYAVAEPNDRWSASFRTNLDPKTFEPTTYSVAASLRRTLAQISGNWTQSRFRASPTDDRLTVATHSIGTMGAFKTPSERFGGMYEFNLDVKNRQLLNQRYSVFYNAQCCGFGVEYQIVNIEHLNQADKYRRTFNFSFTLAGIGSFSNPMGAFRQ